MTLTPPFIAVPLRPHIAEGLKTLTERAESGRLSEADKKIGAELLADAYADVLDHCFVELLHELNRVHPTPMLKEAFGVTEEIKEKIHHYLGWVVGFFSAERLTPVIAHFNRITRELNLHGETGPHCVFAIDPQLAADSRTALATLRNGTATNLDEGVEHLLRVIEAALDTLVLEPKQLMKFNFVVNKTLDGVISLLQTLFKRMLRRLGVQVPRDMYPKVSAHLSRFLVVTAP